jgi:hypothetical protein
MPGESKSGRARELLLEITENEGEQESDTLDARVARETALSARTVKDVRLELNRAGLLKSVAEKDEFGAVERWMVCRTGAPRE